MSESESDDNYNITRVNKHKKQSGNHSRTQMNYKHRQRDYTKNIRYTYCCDKCKYPNKPNGRCCLCVVPRSQRRVKLGEVGCRTCSCKGCTKEDRYYFEQRRDGIKVVDTEGVNYKQHYRSKRRKSVVMV